MVWTIPCMHVMLCTLEILPRHNLECKHRIGFSSEPKPPFPNLVCKGICSKTMTSAGGGSVMPEATVEQARDGTALASSGDVGREAATFVQCCQLLQQEKINEEEAAAAVSAAEKASAVVLHTGEELAGRGPEQAPAAQAFLSSCAMCCLAAFGSGTGGSVASNLGRQFPSLCAQWLVSLKNLASVVALAWDPGLKDRDGESVRNLGMALSLDRVWPELAGVGGVKARRWRARAAAVQLAVCVAVNEGNVWGNSGRVTSSGLGFLSTASSALEDLLKMLVFGLASDHLQVRLAAVDGAKTIISIKFEQLPKDVYSDLLGGILRTCMDPVPEVQKSGCEAVLKLMLLSSPDGLEDTILKLVDKFIKSSLATIVERGGAKSTHALSEDAWLLDSTNAIIGMLLVPGPPFFEHAQGRQLDRLPLLLVAAAAALEEAEKRGDRSLRNRLANLIRSMGRPCYRTSLLAMLNPKAGAYTCDWVASFYKRGQILGDEEVEALQVVSEETVLRGLSSALRGKVWYGDLPVHNDLLPAASRRTDGASGMEVAALQHIVEVLQIPPELSKGGSVECLQSVTKQFLERADSFVQIATSILEDISWLTLDLEDRQALVQDLFLAFASLACPEGREATDVSWTSTDLQKLAVDAACLLSKAVEAKIGGSPSNYETTQDVSKAVRADMKVRGIGGLILSLLPVMIPRIKEIIKSSSNIGTADSIYISSKGGDIGASIVASHQLEWCLRQVQHPHLGAHCELLVPCALTTLDHYSPAVKRQGMRTLLHLGLNLNVSELRWYGDAILDAVCRSLIGCGDLWPLAVPMAVKLGCRIEGRNPRGIWYGRVLVEMLGELERNADDQDRRIVWLKSILPQLEAMGLVLVAHFKRLLPLLSRWLLSPDDFTCILTLRILRQIVMRTWCRIPSHANRIWGELIEVYKNARDRGISADIEAEIQEICRLLYMCSGSKFDAWQGCANEPALRKLVELLEQCKTEKEHQSGGALLTV